MTMPATRVELLGKLDVMIVVSSRRSARRQVRLLRRQLTRDTVHALYACALAEALIIGTMLHLLDCR